MKNLERIIDKRIRNIFVDDEDYERCQWKKWHINRKKERVVVATDIDGKTTSIGRFILRYDGPLEVDHIDRNPFNNQKKNLRLATRAQQMMNSKPQLDREYKGIWQVGWKWRAGIKLNGRQIHLGYYETQEEAAKAYDLKAKKLFGKFALLNFPEELRS